jgi:hypothetical protein
MNEMNTAVVSVDNPEKRIWSGTWFECINFIRNNTWLYGNKLFIREIKGNGLGRSSAAYLWSRWESPQ